MKYLLLDIDDTIAPLSSKPRDSIFIDRMGVKLGIPIDVAKWLKGLSDVGIKIVWCTSRPPMVRSLIEKKIPFESHGVVKFLNPNAYPWNKLYGIIKFCNEHPQDLVILTDNDIKDGTRGISNLPKNLKLVTPSDAMRGCLSKADMELISSL